MRSPKFTLLIVWLLALTLFSCSGDSEEVLAFSPKWEPTACQQSDSVNADTECGYLVVPENRNDPNSREIKLYVTIIHNPNAGPTTPPLVYLTGGPGAPTASAISIFESTDPALAYFRNAFGRDRDIIILDQRGTNRSLPSLYCGQELAPAAQAAYGMSFAEAADKRVPLLEDCYSRFVRDGIDLSGYNTVENATDVRDLAAVLGYPKIKIYAASYGTRLAMVTMRMFPEILESVVLDSVLPPEINPYEWEVNATNFALDSFYQASLAQYPNVKTYVNEIIARLETQPVVVTTTHKRLPTMYEKALKIAQELGPQRTGTEPPELLADPEKDGQPVVVTVDGPKFVGYLIGELKTTPYDQDLPKKIYQMYQSQDYTAVAQSWLGTVDFFWPAGGPGSEATVIGMYNSVFGAGDAHYTTPDRVNARVDSLITNPSIASWYRSNYIRMEPALQGKWPVEPLPPSEADPVHSTVPTMLLVGTLDQATPAIFSENSTVFLPNSFYYRIIAGHATAYLPCVVSMIDSFLVNPNLPPPYLCPLEYSWN